MFSPFVFPVDAILLLGPTGAGKSPLGHMLSSRGFLGRRVHHLDFGAELRFLAARSDAVGSYSEQELLFIREVLELGRLLENEHFSLARKIISVYLQRTGFRPGDILCLNGIPRHKGQANDIGAIADIRALIVLDCPSDSIFCRLQDNIGGDRTERVDDGRELVAKKLQIFEERTAPLIEHYRDSGSHIYRIPITDASSPEDAYLLLSSLASSDPPVTLIAEPPQ